MFFFLEYSVQKYKKQWLRSGTQDPALPKVRKLRLLYTLSWCKRFKIMKHLRGAMAPTRHAEILACINR